MSMNRVVIGAAIVALSTLAIPSSYAAGMPGKNMPKKKGMMMYFKQHTFNFEEYFYQFHPGPHWDLVHAKQLRLTPGQISAEEHLVKGMKRDTIRGITTLKAAYRHYRNYARQKTPKLGTLIHDVKAVGRAQAYLGYEMMPYHLKGYRLLDNAQKSIYKRLARENWMRIMSMRPMRKHA